MFYTIYQITNLLDNKIYIGKHQTKNLDDGYMGSGKRINLDKLKYGLENFKKEILYIFDNELDMNAKEAELVSEDFCARQDTYNMTCGGFGSWNHINSNKEYFVEKAKNTVYNWSEEKKSLHNSKKSCSGNKNGMFNSQRFGKLNPMFGKKQKDETKKKISLANIGKKRTIDQKQKLAKILKESWTDEKKKLRSIEYKNRGIKPPSVAGMLWYNNGLEIKRFIQAPDSTWKRGRKLENP